MRTTVPLACPRGAGLRPSDERRRCSRAASGLGLALGLTLSLGPLVPPAAAQQAMATPTPQPTQVVLQNVNTGPGLAMGTPTPQAITSNQLSGIQVQVITDPVATTGSVLQTGTPPPANLSVSSCSDASGLFVHCPIDGVMEGRLQSWAVQSTLQLYELPASDSPRLMSSARDSLRALILARVLSAAQKPASQQTPEEQAAIAAISTRIKQFKINVAQDAITEYGRWQQNPFCYQPPQAALSAGTWDCNPTPTPAERLQPPSPPSFEQFEAWGNAIELAKLGQAGDGVVGEMGLRMKVLAGMAGSSPGVVGAGVLAGNLMPQSWFRVAFPYRFKEYVYRGMPNWAARNVGPQTAQQSLVAETEAAAEDASAAASAEAGGLEAVTDTATAAVDSGLVTTETVIESAAATATTAEVVGSSSTFGISIGTGTGAIVGSTVGIIFICATTIVQAAIDLATRLALPDKLNGALTSAQNYTPNLAGADNAFAQAIFAGMTAPDPTPDPGPASSASDLPLSADDPGSPRSIHYLAPDGSFHTARAPHDGWWVDTDASGASRLTLAISFVNPDRQIWTATRVGSSVIVGRDVDADPSGQATTTTFQYLDWNPSDHSQLLTRHASLAASRSTETWGIGATSVNIGGNAIQHFDSASGQWTSVDGGALVIAVGPTGQPWVVNKQGAVYRRSRGNTGYVDGTWSQIAPNTTATNISAGGPLS